MTTKPTADVTPADITAARIAIRSQSSPAVERILRLERIAQRAESALRVFASEQDRADLRDLTGVLAELRHFTQFAEGDLRIVGVRSHYNPDNANQQDVAQRLVTVLLQPARD